MAQNKTTPTTVSVDEYLQTVSEQRRSEAYIIIGIMERITGLKPAMWGPSIIGFGTRHYVYDSGREGDMPLICFSPRSTAITIYFNGLFDSVSELLAKLGKHKLGGGCLYIPTLAAIDLSILTELLQKSYEFVTNDTPKPTTVEQYMAAIPSVSRPAFDALRTLVITESPQATESLSYGIVGYKTTTKSPRLYISAWKDHVALYPLPKDASLLADLKPYIRGKGTLWLALDKPLPEALLRRVVHALID